MSTWGKRLKEIREKYKMSQNDLAVKLMKDSTQVSRYELGRVKTMSRTLYRQLLNIFTEEDVHYIETGEYEKVSEKNLNKYTVTKSNNTINIPILSIKASAGLGNNIESVDIFKSGNFLEVTKSLFKLPPNVNKLYAIQVDGESMIPRLLPDSWVIFEEAHEWAGDGLYVINYNNVLMVKLIEVNPKNGNLFIKSINPQYSSWEYDPKEDNSSFKIVGKVLRSIV